jgi:hypothetical protein
MFATIYPSSLGAAPDNGVTPSVFIPISDLYGISAGELALNQSGILKEGKSIYGALNALYYKLPTTALGLTITKGIPQGSIVDVYTVQITLNFQWVTDLANRTIKPVPLPNSGVGKVTIADIFPNAILIENEGAIQGEGLAFSHSTANNYGAITPTALNTDARDWIYSLFLAMCATATVRSTGVESAIFSAPNFLTIRNSGIFIPAAWYDATAPLTGLTSSQLPITRVNPDILNITYEVVENPQLQTSEVRIAVG